MDKISVIIITYNEEQNIKECLESVQWADEIIIVDAFSSDKTLEICKDYTNKIYQREWKGYADQKNFALSFATSPWVFWIDADERVTPELKREIKERIKDNRFAGFYVKRKNYFKGVWLRYGGWYPDYTLRIFKKEAGHFEEKRVHEKVILKGRVDYLKNHLLHYTYNSLNEYIYRQNIYTQLAAEDLYKQGKKYRVHRGFLLFKFLTKFLETYFYKGGILDGYYGFLISISASYFASLKYAKFKEIKEGKDGEKSLS